MRIRHRTAGFTAISLMIVVVITGIVLAVIFGARGCGVVDEDTAREAVEKQGYRVIDVTDSHRWSPGYHGCGEDDNIAYEMVVENARGQTVEITACCGQYKNCTVRTR